MNTILSVDVSSHNPPSKPALDGWIAQGCQLLWIHSYHGGESAGLDQYTRLWIGHAQEAACWRLPYSWLFRSYPPERAVAESLDVFTGVGEQPNLIMLDAETYGNPVTDPGPTVDQILAAATMARLRNAQPILYTGQWWIDSWLEGDKAKLAGLPTVLSKYDGVPTLDGMTAPYGLELIGKQYTSTPEDWSVWNYDRLAELAGAQQPSPCAALTAAIDARLARRPWKAVTKAELAAMRALVA